MFRVLHCIRLIFLISRHLDSIEQILTSAILISTVGHKGHYIKKVNCILHTAPYTNKKVAANKKEMLLQIKKDVAANKNVL